MHNTQKKAVDSLLATDCEIWKGYYLVASHNGWWFEWDHSNFPQSHSASSCKSFATSWVRAKPDCVNCGIEVTEMVWPLSIPLQNFYSQVCMVTANCCTCRQESITLPHGRKCAWKVTWLEYALGVVCQLTCITRTHQITWHTLYRCLILSPTTSWSLAAGSVLHTNPSKQFYLVALAEIPRV
jgi:hypothetical protein